MKSKKLSLQDMPDDLKTTEVCLAAVRQSGRDLRFVPDALKTAEICAEAVRQNRWVLEFVPEALKEMVQEPSEPSSAPMP